MLYTSAVRLDPPVAHLVVSGELDAFSAPNLRREIDGAIAGGSREFTVDTGGVTFIDAAGLGTFVRLRNELRALGGTLTFATVSVSFLWVCTIAGLHVPFGLNRPEGRARAGAVAAC
jgi:anti-sigma B factor antagonist